MCMNYEFNLLHHVGVVAKRVCAAAAAHEGDDNTPSGPTGRGVKKARGNYFLISGSALTTSLFKRCVISKPSKHHTSFPCWYNVGPPSATPSQY